MSAPCILTIEDDPAIRRGIVDSPKATGHVVWQADRADTGIEKALSKPCDLVLLDLVLVVMALTCLLRYESKNPRFRSLF